MRCALTKILVSTLIVGSVFNLNAKDNQQYTNIIYHKWNIEGIMLEQQYFLDDYIGLGFAMGYESLHVSGDPAQNPIFYSFAISLSFKYAEIYYKKPFNVVEMDDIFHAQNITDIYGIQLQWPFTFEKVVCTPFIGLLKKPVLEYLSTETGYFETTYNNSIDYGIKIGYLW